PLIEVGDFTQAQRFIVESLEIVLSTRSFKVTTVLTAISYWYLKKNAIEAAVMTYAVAKQHQFVAKSRWCAIVVEEPISLAAQTLTPERVEAAFERGRTRDMWGYVDSLLNEFK
ncbi:MAG: hypothetical protein AAF633_18795, partial [Chloroflexota bacterium]